MISSHERRIARNTVFLYGRMLFTVFVSLYTSRVVLEMLGVDDYGIYHLVGGIVTIFAFLNGTMSAATMRFLNFEIGNSGGDVQAVKRVFGTAMTIHIGIALILLLLAETVGLWFVNAKLDIAPERMAAANWVYQFSILATIVTVVQIPYSATIMAYERMDALAGIQVFYTVLKLFIALLLLWVVTFDTLICYGALFFIITLIIGLCYMLYCVRNFEVCRGRIRASRQLAGTMVRYSGWDTFGNLSHTVRFQGVGVILNNFGGAALNAAASLAVTVSLTLQNFATTVVSAFRPQIVQQYAQSNFPYMLKLLYNAGRYSLLLMLVFAIPVLVEMPYILEIWLKDVPDYTVVFSRLCIIATLGEVLKTVVDSGIHATGRIARLSFISGVMLLAELPAMYFLLKYFELPPIVYMVHAIWIFAIVLAECLILRYQLPEFSIRRYLSRALFSPALVAVPAVAAALCVNIYLPSNFGRLVLVTVTSTLALGLLTYFCLLDKEMRADIRNKILLKLKLKQA